MEHLTSYQTHLCGEVKLFCCAADWWELDGCSLWADFGVERTLEGLHFREIAEAVPSSHGPSLPGV